MPNSLHLGTHMAWNCELPCKNFKDLKVIGVLCSLNLPGSGAMNIYGIM